MNENNEVSIIESAMVSAEIIKNNNYTYTDMQGSSNFEIAPEQMSHTDYNHESLRHLSLLSWINKHVSKAKLARYGFYYNLESDYVKCHFCEVVIGEWGVGDDPLTEHHKHSPECDFINLKPTSNVPYGDEVILKNELREMRESIKSGKRNGSTKFDIELIPRHPIYKDEKSRLESYTNWPKFMRQTPNDLSVAGFFYLGVGDEVKCFFCGGCLKDWEETDTPIEEHKKHFSSQCTFIKKNYLDLKRKYSKQFSKNLVKATSAQIGELTKYMDQNNDLKEGKINLGSNKALYNQMWEYLSEHLNSYDGPRKTTKSWKEVWRNHKYNSKRKSCSSPKSSELDQEPAYKKIKSYHSYQQFQNGLSVEPDTTDSSLEISHNNQVVSTNSTTVTKYQPRLGNSSHTVNNSMDAHLYNKNLELEVYKHKCEKEQLQLELHKLQIQLEKQELQRKIDYTKQELERTCIRLQTDSEMSYFQFL